MLIVVAAVLAVAAVVVVVAVAAVVIAVVVVEHGTKVTCQRICCNWLFMVAPSTAVTSYK